MKKRLSIVVALAMLFSLFTALPASAELSTTEIDGKTYYEIATAEDYAEFVTMANSDLTINGKLIADIDLDGQTVDPIGTHATAAANRKNYTGTFDGNNHVIKNLTITKTYSGDTNNAGFAMFAQLNGATIKNLGIEGANITVTQSSGKAGVRLGILACWAEGTTSIENCYVKNSTLTVIGTGYVQAAGPIAACLGADASVSNCYVIDSTVTALSKITGSSGVASSGFVGYISSSTKKTPSAYR